MKRIKISAAFLMALSLLLLVASFLPSYSETEIYDKILRLHVVANSDSHEDQQLKLKVRDAILELGEELCSDIHHISDAKELYSEKLDLIKEKAEEVIAENGYDYPVTVCLKEEYFPVRSYEDVCLPSGKYLSLRIKIGQAEGENWWCVLYPPICLSAASPNEEFIQAGFTGDQIKIITENDSSVRYNIKFKLLESFKSLFDKLKK